MKSLGISVKVEHWNFDKNLPKKKCPNFTEVRHVITQAISKYQSKVLQNKIAGTTETLQSLLNEKEQLKKVTLDKFLGTLIEELRNQNKVGNSYAYLNLKTTIAKFLGEKLKIEFKDITVEFCSAFEKWMRNNQMRLLHFRMVLIDVPVILAMFRNEYPFFKSLISSVYCSFIIDSDF